MKEARQQSFSSAPRFMCRDRADSASMPKASKMTEIFSRFVMTKLRLPSAPSGGWTSKLTPKARRKSLGRRAAKASDEVMILMQSGEKVWQYSNMP